MINTFMTSIIIIFFLNKMLVRYLKVLINKTVYKRKNLTCAVDYNEHLMNCEHPVTAVSIK